MAPARFICSCEYRFSYSRSGGPISQPNRSGSRAKELEQPNLLRAKTRRSPVFLLYQPASDVSHQVSGGRLRWEVVRCWISLTVCSFCFDERGNDLQIPKEGVLHSAITVSPCAPVAQRLEQQTHNLLVRGSNPCGGTKRFSDFGLPIADFVIRHLQ